jgi:polyphosphate kinase 2 (PPK2 family)
MGFFVGSWHTRPIVDRVFDRIGDRQFNLALDRIQRFEEMLAREGVLLLKFWLHLTKPEQRRRLRQIEADPATRWRVTKLDWKYARHYDDFRRVSEGALRRTDSGQAPWHIIDGGDWRYRSLTAARILESAVRERLAAKPGDAGPWAAPPTLKPKKPNIISRLDLAQSRDKAGYEKRMPKLQAKLNLLYRRLKAKERSLILVFEGPDAAGKGGTIRRVTQALDARNYQVISVAAPTDEERAHPYLWRFWRHLPRLGRATIYDRSWYGRVLVERVEGFCAPEEWQRAYAEINEFEAQLAEFGTVRSNSGWPSAPRSSCAASRTARSPPTSNTKSPRKTGATAGNGAPTRRPPAT